MKKVVFTMAILFSSAIILTSCREETEKEVIIKEVPAESSEESEEREGILERTAKKVDKEVNKEVDEEIEKIGDDN